jgi:hypothetical protein
MKKSNNIILSPLQVTWLLITITFLLIAINITFFNNRTQGQKTDICSPNTVKIPNSAQIQEFCKIKGYDSGWLASSSCKENQVMCHLKVGDLDKNRCVDWWVDYAI